MLERKADLALSAWKKSVPKKSLMVRGARQVGKTWLVREFGKREYRSYIEVNLLKMPELKNVFSGNLDVDTLLLNFSLYLPDAEFLPGETLLFLDEIQECPEAITSLKFWVEDGRFDVITSGSMLGIDYKRPDSWPVGSMAYLDMHALDFEEFLWGAGINKQVIAHVRQCYEAKMPVSDAVHTKMMFYLRQYLVVGGMPEVVSLFFEKQSLAAADQKQRDILNDYRYDIAHYAEADIKLKAERCYFSMPDQLAKENHKFQYSIVEKGSNARKYGSSLDWLENADLVYRCYNVKSLKFPLQNYRDTTNFRMYPSDIGLLIGMYSYDMKVRLMEDAGLEEVKGGIYEALVADMLVKNGHRELYFRKNEQATFEIEFLLEKPEGIVPLEVKSRRGRSKSLDNVLKREEIPYGYKLTAGNVGVQEKKITLPLYMAMFI